LSVAADEVAARAAPLIVTIPGLWNRGIEGWLLRRHLSAEAKSAAVVFRYRTTGDTFEHTRARLMDFIESLPASPVNLVGHSLGGLLALAALNDLPPGSVHRAVLLGPPLRGSRAVRSALANIPGSRWVIGRKAPLLSDGLDLAPPEGVDVGVIAGSGGVGLGRAVTRFRGPNDGTIAVDETHLEGARQHLVMRVTHTGMLFSSDVARQAAHFLQTGSFEPLAGA